MTDFTIDIHFDAPNLGECTSEANFEIEVETGVTFAGFDGPQTEVSARPMYFRVGALTITRAMLAEMIGGAALAKIETDVADKYANDMVWEAE